MVVKNTEISAAEVPPEEQEVSVPSQAPQLRTPVLGRGVHRTSDRENQLKAVGNPDILLKGQYMNSHSQALTLGSCGGTGAWWMADKYKDKLSRVTSGQGLEGQLPLFLC